MPFCSDLIFYWSFHIAKNINLICIDTYHHFVYQIVKETCLLITIVTRLDLSKGSPTIGQWHRLIKGQVHYIKGEKEITIIIQKIALSYHHSQCLSYLRIYSACMFGFVRVRKFYTVTLCFWHVCSLVCVVMLLFLHVCVCDWYVYVLYLYTCYSLNILITFFNLFLHLMRWVYLYINKSMCIRCAHASFTLPPTPPAPSSLTCHNRPLTTTPLLSQVQHLKTRRGGNTASKLRKTRKWQLIQAVWYPNSFFFKF